MANYEYIKKRQLAKTARKKKREGSRGKQFVANTAAAKVRNS